MLEIKCDGCGYDIFVGDHIYCEQCQEELKDLQEFNYTRENLNLLVKEIMFQIECLPAPTTNEYKKELRYKITREIKKFLEEECHIIGE
jgi:hypothetical protein